jgi:adenylate cyclase
MPFLLLEMMPQRCIVFLTASVFSDPFLHPFWIVLILLPLLLLILYAIRLARQCLAEQREKQHLRKLLSGHVPPVVLQELLKHPGKINLRGEKKECTFLNAELNGFSRGGDSRTPAELIELINRFLAQMASLVQQHRGTLDRYDGSVVRAFFGAPLNSQNHALQACQTALMMRRAFTEMRREWLEKGLPDLELRIGISSGAAVVGAIGSDSHAVYSALGEAAGLSRKLMNTNSIYGTSLLLEEKTYRQAKEHIIARQLDLLRIRESRIPIRIYELMALKEETLDIQTREILQYFGEGYRLYLAQNWDWAMNQFRQVLQINGEDAPARLYLFRCQEFLENPPEAGWDGVYSVKSKS